MVLGIDNEGQKDEVNSKGQEKTRIPVIGDVVLMEEPLHSKVDGSQQYAVKAKYDHCSNRYIKN